MEFKSKSRRADDSLLKLNRQSNQRSIGSDLYKPRLTSEQVARQQAQSAAVVQASLSLGREQQERQLQVSPQQLGAFTRFDRSGQVHVQRQQQRVAPVLQAADLRRQDDLAVQRTQDNLGIVQRSVQASSQTLSAYGLAPAGPLDVIQLQREESRQAALAPVSPLPLNPVQRQALMRDAEDTIGAALTRDAKYLPAAGRADVAHAAVQRYAQQGLNKEALRGVMVQRAPDENTRESVNRLLTAQRRQEIQAQEDREERGLLLSHYRLKRQLQDAQVEHDGQQGQNLSERIQARQGAGQPLPTEVRRQLELGLNADLSRVRIHDDSEADKLAKSIGAVAFTSGQDIFFRAGKYQPGTPTGFALLLHEGTHTVQQARGQAKPGIDADPGLEQEAVANEGKAALTPEHSVPGGKSGAAPQVAGIQSAGPQVAVQRLTAPAAPTVSGEPGQGLNSHVLGHFTGEIGSIPSGNRTITLFLKTIGPAVSGTYVGVSGNKYAVEGSLVGEHAFAVTTVHSEVKVEISGLLSGGKISGQLLNVKQGFSGAFQLAHVADPPASKPLDPNVKPWSETLTPAMRKKLPALNEPEFLKKLQAMCARLSIEPDMLLSVMAFESANSVTNPMRGLDPKADNGLGYYGLIQFGEDAAKDLNVSDQEKFTHMTAVEQLLYVEKYLNLSFHGIPKAIVIAKKEGRPLSLEELYMSVLAGNAGAANKPAWKTKATNPTGYHNNEGLDADKDGQITPTEAADAVRLHWRETFGTNIDERSQHLERVWYTAKNKKTGKMERQWRVQYHDEIYSAILNGQPKQASSAAKQPVVTASPEQQIAPPVNHAAHLETITIAESRRIKVQRDWGASIGAIDGIHAFYNDGDGEKNGEHVDDRHYSQDNQRYEYGLKWQCVEFIRRYYYDMLKIEFAPRSGNADAYFDYDATDGGINSKRGLRQFKNGGSTKPQYQDIIVMGQNSSSSVGHIAIVVSADEDGIVIAQQNVGSQFNQTIDLKKSRKGGRDCYTVVGKSAKLNVLGWMRK